MKTNSKGGNKRKLPPFSMFQNNLKIVFKLEGLKNDE